MFSVCTYVTFGNYFYNMEWYDAQFGVFITSID